MISCPLCMKKMPSYRPRRWEPNYRCSCGALFNVRCRWVLPHFAALGLRRSEPICFPPPHLYFVYFYLLKRFFSTLRHRSSCDASTRQRAGLLLPICDLIRFGGKHVAPVVSVQGEVLVDPSKCEFTTPANHAHWPEINDFEEFHTNLDFASWCLERIANGQFSDREAQGFGYIYQHFPHVRGFISENSDVAAAWKMAEKGKLPTLRRAQIRSRLPW